MAAAVLYLVDNDFVTGVCLPVDGGRTIFAADSLCVGTNYLACPFVLSLSTWRCAVNQNYFPL